MQHGLSWYEISNWARPGGQCEHNLGYWRGDNWWGFGPGAHSHVDGVRWWNVKRPEPTSRCWPRVRVRRLPARWSAPKAGNWRVMLQVRLAHGIPADVYPPQRTARLRDTGLLEDADGAACA